MDWKQYYNFLVVIWARSMDPKLVHTFCQVMDWKHGSKRILLFFVMDGKHGSEVVLYIFVTLWMGSMDPNLVHTFSSGYGREAWI